MTNTNPPAAKVGFFASLGETPTGRLINTVRLGTSVLGLTSVLCAVIATSFALFGVVSTAAPLFYEGCLALFGGGVVLILLSSIYRVKSNPFLVASAVELAVKKDVPIDQVSQLVRSLEAHSGLAGLFNRLGFSGVSLGAVASAVLVLLLGMVAVGFAILPQSDFAIFADLAKLLFGAFVGSFASSAARTLPSP
jgi:hypothetical protein